MTRLLVVEDNAILAVTLVRFLRKQGYQTVEPIAHTSETALLQLPNLHVDLDLVLVDVALPGMNGIELVANVQKDYPELPCIILSAHDEMEYVGRALAAGAKGYVVKGDPLALLQGIAVVLSGEIYLSEQLKKKL